MPLTRAELTRLLRMLERTRPEELDCSEVLHRVAGAIECMASGAELRPEYDAVLQHLQVCEECCEEADALRRILDGE